MNKKCINLLFKCRDKELKIQNDSAYQLLEIEGLESAEYNINTVDNANDDGCFISSARVEKRIINLRILLNENIEIGRKNLISFFSPKFSGKMLVNYYDKEKLINYRVEDLEFKILKNMFSKQVAEIELICVDPFFHAVSPVRIDVATWKPKFHFPLQLPTLMGLREPNLIANVINDGDVESGIIVKFKANGTVVNPSFFNIKTREYFKINKTMKANDVITVNTNIGHKTVTCESDSKIENILNLWDLKGSFIQLDVGDNLFRYDADEGLENLDIILFFDPSYLGI